jgi:hypothetical protein
LMFSGWEILCMNIYFSLSFYRWANRVLTKN